jgi:hypothetical protein
LTVVRLVPAARERQAFASRRFFGFCDGKRSQKIAA